MGGKAHCSSHLVPPLWLLRENLTPPPPPPPPPPPGVTPVVPSPYKSGSGALIFWEELHALIHPLLQVHLK
jgi:hypothetical protein